MRRQTRGELRLEAHRMSAGVRARHREATPAPTRRPGQRIGLWVGLVTAGLTLLLVRAGVSTGDWRGVVVSEVQVLVVAAVAYWGLRTGS